MNYCLMVLLTSSKLLAAVSTSELTVAHALALPTAEIIQNRLATRGIVSRNSNSEKMVLEELKAILDGTYKSTNRSDSLSSHSCGGLQETLSGLLSQKQLTTLKMGVLNSLRTLIPSLTSSLLMSTIAKTCTSVHQTLKQQKNRVEAQEKQLSSSPLVSIAHSFALEAVIKLMFIVYSPYANPCERMHALYLLNSMHLLGNTGELFKRWRNRANRFYFSSDGKLLEFDPSRENSQLPKRIKALNNCLKIFAHSHEEYRTLLSSGIKVGITQLSEYLNQIPNHPWLQKKNRFLWIYAAEFFRETTSLDVMYLRTVDPSRIFSHQENKDLLSLMLLTSSYNFQETKPYEAAQKFLKSREKSPSAPLLKRYFNALEKNTQP